MPEKLPIQSHSPFPLLADRSISSNIERMNHLHGFFDGLHTCTCNLYEHRITEYEILINVTVFTDFLYETQTTE